MRVCGVSEIDIIRTVLSRMGYISKSSTKHIKHKAGRRKKCKEEDRPRGFGARRFETLVKTTLTLQLRRFWIHPQMLSPIVV